MVVVSARASRSRAAECAVYAARTVVEMNFGRGAAVVDSGHFVAATSRAMCEGVLLSSAVVSNARLIVTHMLASFVYFTYRF